EAVVAEGEPQFKRTEAAREFERLFEESEAFNGVAAEYAGVVTGMRKSVSRCVGIAIKQAAAVQRLIQPFMWIERNGVGQFQSLKATARGNCRQCTVSSINVEPGIVLACDSSYLRKRVDRARVDGSGGGDHRDRSLPRLFIPCDGSLEFLGQHMEGSIGTHKAQVFTADSEQRDGFRDRHVHFFRRVDGHFC